MFHSLSPSFRSASFAGASYAPLVPERRHQRAIAFSLMLLMVLTRGHHFASLHHLPEASWAIFFLAGVYLLPAYFSAFCFLATSLDTIAITWGGVSGFCVSGAYFMLLPAYGACWLAGRWYAARHRMAVFSLVPLALALVAGAFAAELFSSGGFYFLSGRFEPTLSEFLAREQQYFPPGLGGMTLYLGIALFLHIGLAPGISSRSPRLAIGEGARHE